MSVNATKCRVVTFSRKSSNLIFDYSIDNLTLERVYSIKDLGVTFDSKLTFIDHINTITNSALRMLGFIIRITRKFSSIDSILSLYFSFVRSKLEYASLVWSPIYKYQINLLEQVQRRSLKFIYFKQHGYYPEQGFSHMILLNLYNIDSLELRRNYADLKFLFNLLNNGLDSPTLLENINFFVPRPASRSSNVFYCVKPNTNVMIKSPIYRICTNFNSLSDFSTDINFSSITSLLKKCTTTFHYV